MNAKILFLVKHMNISQYLAILLLTISCADTGVLPEKPSSHLDVTEIQGSKQPNLAPSGRKDQDYKGGEILVRFKDGTNKQTIEAIQGKLHLKTIYVFSDPNLYLMKVPGSSSVKTIMEHLRNYKEVKYSEPNYTRSVDELR